MSILPAIHYVARALFYTRVRRIALRGVRNACIPLVTQATIMLGMRDMVTFWALQNYPSGFRHSRGRAKKMLFIRRVICHVSESRFIESISESQFWDTKAFELYSQAVISDTPFYVILFSTRRTRRRWLSVSVSCLRTQEKVSNTYPFLNRRKKKQKKEKGKEKKKNQENGNLNLESNIRN